VSIWLLTSSGRNYLQLTYRRDSNRWLAQSQLGVPKPVDIEEEKRRNPGGTRLASRLLATGGYIGGCIGELRDSGWGFGGDAAWTEAVFELNKP